MFPFKKMKSDKKQDEMLMKGKPASAKKAFMKADKVGDAKLAKKVKGKKALVKADKKKDEMIMKKIMKGKK